LVLQPQKCTTLKIDLQAKLAVKRAEKSVARGMKGIGSAKNDWRIQTPRRQPHLADQLYEQILNRIVAGALPVNSKLPSEAQLAGLFEVSRPVVREALSRLQADGVVVSKHGSGSFIQRRPAHAFAVLAPPGDVASLMRCVELRIALEGEAAALAARRRTEVDLTSMANALTELNSIIAGSKVGMEADLKFHLAIARASQNLLFVQALESLSEITLKGMELARSLSLRRSKERLNLVQQEHIRIYEAIKAENTDQARDAMRTHIDNARIRVLTDSIEP
jgi:GntR family transcriptional regulator, transcriptional repressor for pyruvate dehydrogenase complex